MSLTRAAAGNIDSSGKMAVKLQTLRATICNEIAHGNGTA